MKPALFLCFILFFTAYSFLKSVKGEFSGDGWFLNDSGTLTVFKNDVPHEWKAHKDLVKTVVVDDGVTQIGNGAFENFCSLTHAFISDNVKSIRDSAFDGCKNLTDVVFSRNLQSIGAGAFRYSRLIDLILPDTVVSIGPNCFESCSELKTVILPANLKTVDNYAFRSCEKLESMLWLNKKSSSGGSDPLNGCDSLDRICVLPDFSGTSLFGKNISWDPQSCELLKPFLNHCYEPVRNGTTVLVQKRKNATEWEEQTNECVNSVCVNESGGVRKSVCDIRACVKGECEETGTDTSKKWSVEVEVEKVEPEKVDVEEIVSSMEALVNIPRDQIKIRLEVDDEGFVVKVIFYVDDEESAGLVTDTIKSECNISQV